MAGAAGTECVALGPLPVEHLYRNVSYAAALRVGLPLSNFAVPIKRPEILDEFTRALIESLATPGVEQQARKTAPEQ